MSNYTEISRDEFESFLNDNVTFETTDVAGVDEVVYDLPLPSDQHTIRVFSTIDKASGRTRACGSDAIRCVIWNHEADQPVGGRSRTHRIETWRSNLLPKIQSLYGEWRNYAQDCPDCGSPMCLREPGTGDNWNPFFGCSAYPRCNSTLTV